MVRYTTSDSKYLAASEGVHEFEIVKAEEYTNPNTGKKSLLVEFNYMDSETMEEMRHTEFVLLTIGTGDKFRVLSDLMILSGLNPETEGGQFDEEKLVGKKGKMRIAHSVYQGKTRANIMEISKKA